MNNTTQEDPNSKPSFSRYLPFLISFASGFCIVLSFHPFGLSWAAWFAPVGFLYLIDRDPLPAKKPKLQIWLGCFVSWLILFQCVRLPHWAGYFGWPILSAYLCCYPYLFVMISRHVVHLWKLPIVVAAPIIWGGLEWLQAHFLTGISLGMLSHTQVSFPILIQVADIGCYTISFLMVLIASGIFQFSIYFFRQQGNRKSAYIGLAIALLAVGFMLVYGSIRIAETDRETTQHDFRVALIQGAIDTQFPANPNAMREYLNKIRIEYYQLTVAARDGAKPEDVDRDGKNLKLIIWPESMFLPFDAYSDSNEISGSDKEDIQRLNQTLAVESKIASGAYVVNDKNEVSPVRESVPMLLGSNSGSVEVKDKVYNSAIQIDLNGKVASRYAKMNLVLFGEFVPLGDVYPWIYNFFPMGPGLKAGKSPTAMSFGEFKLCPNICFESTYPHLIRRQIAELTANGNKPDCIVNLSNDGWFWGSNALDMHFANNVLRSVENRTPTLIAANTGFSGQIDSAGRVIHKGPRRQKKIIYADLITTKQVAVYQKVGDWPWFFCFLAVLLAFCNMIRGRILRRKLQLHVQGETAANQST